MRYQSFDPKAELNGTSTQCFMKCVHLQHDYFSEIVAQHGFDHVDREKWYSLQSVLDVVNDMIEVTDISTDLISLGVAAAELGLELMAPEQKSMSLCDFLANYPAIYQSRHRGNVGVVRVEQSAPNVFTLRAHIPYPDDVFYGWMWGYARGLRARNTNFAVAYDPDLPRHDQGAPETVLHITLN